MGYSRVGSSLLCRASRPVVIPRLFRRRFDLFAIVRDARNRAGLPPLFSPAAWYSGRHAFRFVVGSVAQHRPGDPRHLVGERSRCDIRV
jgi:hypothetical protein